jgi:hypothetical protein
MGGEIPGFLNQQGAYAKGVTALAYSYPNMNFAWGFGKNVKRSPKKAARNCAKMIKKQLTNKYDEKIILAFNSPTTMMTVPGIKDFSNIKSKTLAKIMLPMTSFVQKVFQKGLGTDQETLEEFVKHFPDYGAINLTNMNGLTLETNCHFLNKKVLKKTFLALVIESDIKYNLNCGNAVELTDKKFKITKTTKNRRIVKEINNKPAFEELQRIMGWTKEEELLEDRWLITTFKYPFTYQLEDKTHLRCLAMILGDYLGFYHRIENTDITMGKITRQSMVDSVDELLNVKKPIFGYFVSCIVRQGFLGIKSFEIQEKLKDYFNGKPFLLLYSGGELIKKPNQQPEQLNEAITSAIFKEI